MSIITTNDELEAFTTRCAQAPFLAVDTEFLRFNTYYPKLCLVQIATPDEIAMVDPLAAGLSLKLLAPLFENNTIIKVFHACRQDIEILRRELDVQIHNVFDTQIAAMFCGDEEQLGYHRLVSSMLGIDLDKSCQFSEWDMRPLPKKQQTYALADVDHLREIYVLLDAKLRQEKKHAWFVEDMERLARDIQTTRCLKEAWRKCTIPRQSYQHFTLIKALASWREKKAMEADLPRSWVLKDKDVTILAAKAPKTSKAVLSCITSSRFAKNESWVKEVVELIKVTAELPASRPPMSLASKAQPQLVPLLKYLLREKSLRMGIAESLITRQQDLAILTSSEVSKHHHHDLPILQGWRYELIGEEALDIKYGRKGIWFRKNKVIVSE